MAYEVTDRPGGGSHLTMKPESAGINFKKYNLTGTDIEAADNGFIISCRYKIKPEAETKKMDYDDRYQHEKHVCVSKEDAAAFISARLTGSDYKAPAAPAAKKSGKVKVTR